jgi:hypothetical protein
VDADDQFRRAFVERNPGWALEAVPLYRVENGDLVPSPFYYAIARRTEPGNESDTKEGTGRSIPDAIATVERELQ